MRANIHKAATALIIIFFVATPFVAAFSVSRQDLSGSTYGSEFHYITGVGGTSIAMMFVYIVLGITAGVVVAWKIGRREGSVIMMATSIGLLLGVLSCFTAIGVYT